MSVSIKRPSPAARVLGGFTIVELMVTLAILALLASVAMPMIEHTMQRDKELVLRRSLREIRQALDAYKQAAASGEIALNAGESGYPATLNVLASGVPSIKESGKQLYFLRHVPRDPFAADSTINPAQSWGLRSFDTPPESPRYTHDVFDVYSLSSATGLNGVPYRDW